MKNRRRGSRCEKCGCFHLKKDPCPTISSEYLGHRKEEENINEDTCSLGNLDEFERKANKILETSHIDYGFTQEVPE